MSRKSATSSREAGLPACRFIVQGVAAERNVRGQEMRRVRLAPLKSAALQTEGDRDADPDAHISALFNPTEAKRFQVGDEFDVIFREVK